MSDTTTPPTTAVPPPAVRTATSIGKINLKAFESVPKLEAGTEKATYRPWYYGTLTAIAFNDADDYVADNRVAPTSDEALDAFLVRDRSLAAAILSTLDLGYEYHSCMDPGQAMVPFKARTLLKQLVRDHGGAGAQHTYALARKLVESKCGEGEDVEAWMLKVTATYRELKQVNFDLDQLVVSVLLAGLPERFVSIANTAWIGGVTPTIEDIRQAASRLNKAFAERAGSETALAARAESSAPDLHAFYAAQRKIGRKPSKDHPCVRCQSPEHWVIDCPEPASGGNGRGGKGGGKNKSGGKKNGGGAGKGDGATPAAKPAEPKAETPAAIATVGAAVVPDMTPERALAMVASGITSFSEDVEFCFVAAPIAEADQVITTSVDLTSVDCLVARESRWIPDSGAGENMTGDKSSLHAIHTLSNPIRIATAGGTTLTADLCGTTVITSHTGAKVGLSRVLYVPGLGFNLLSVPQLTSLGAKVVFEGTGCMVYKDGQEVLRAGLEGKTYFVDSAELPRGVPELDALALAAVPADLVNLGRGVENRTVKMAGSRASWETWHLRLAHLGADQMKLLFARLSKGAKLSRAHAPACVCEGCVMGKISTPTSADQWA